MNKNWKLPSEVAYKEWEAKFNGFKWEVEPETRYMREAEECDARAEQAESDLIAALDLLEEMAIEMESASVVHGSLTMHNIAEKAKQILNQFKP